MGYMPSSLGRLKIYESASSRENMTEPHATKRPRTEGAGGLTAARLDASRFVSLLEKLIGEAEHLQNHPAQGLFPKEDLAAAHVLELLEPHSVSNGGPLLMERVIFTEGRSNLIVTYPCADAPDGSLQTLSLSSAATWTWFPPIPRIGLWIPSSSRWRQVSQIPISPQLPHSHLSQPQLSHSHPSQCIITAILLLVCFVEPRVTSCMVVGRPTALATLRSSPSSSFTSPRRVRRSRER